MNVTPDSSSSPVAVGDPAPDFELFTDQGKPWRLSDHRGTPVLLLFFPGAFTSVCTTELNTVNNSRTEYGKTEVVGISTDAPFVLDEFRSVHGFDFPLLSDHEAEVCERYGVKYHNNFTSMNLDRIARRAAFVVDREGTVQYREVLENAGDLPDFVQIQEVLNGLGV